MTTNRQWLINGNPRGRALEMTDFKYHEYFDADGKILIADVGHYESEWRTSALIANVIKHKFTKFAVRLASVNTNPVQIR